MAPAAALLASRASCSRDRGNGDDRNGDNLNNECNPGERAHLSKCHLPPAGLESAYSTAALNWATITAAAKRNRTRRRGARNLSDFQDPLPQRFRLTSTSSSAPLSAPMDTGTDADANRRAGESALRGSRGAKLAQERRHYRVAQNPLPLREETQVPRSCEGGWVDGYHDNASVLRHPR
jgi:hypothetical protein